MGKKIEGVRPTQTKTKHQILSAYLKNWMGIIFWGVKKAPVTLRQHPHFVYVDAFAYTGKYTKGDIDDPNSKPVYGSPIIGIQQLDQFAQYARDEAFPITRNVILLEKDINTYKKLLATLDEVGVGDRVRETTDFHNLRDGEIAVANVDATRMGPALAQYTNQDYTWSFYLLDPYGGSGIPYDFVNQIVSGPRHDVMINFIYLAFLRELALVLKPDEKLSAREWKKIEIWARVFGEKRWTEVYTNYQYQVDKEYGPGLDKNKVTHLMVTKYADVLRDMDRTITVKTIDLQFSEKERTMLYLFLTTHDPTGALVMNKVLHEAQLLELSIRAQVSLAKRVRAGQPTLFDYEDVRKESVTPKLPRPKVAEVEKTLIDMFAGKRVSLKQIYHEMTDTDFFPSEVKKAIRSLRKKNRAEFSGNKLSIRTRIIFHK